MATDFLKDSKDSKVSKDSKDSEYFKSSNETILYIKSNNIEIMIGNEKNEITEELFEYLLQRYQEGLEESTRRSNLFYDAVDLLYCKLHKASLNRGRSCIDSSTWLKKKRATINPKTNDDQCFQYALSVALNYQSIEKDPQRILEIKPFISQYDWKEINVSSNKKEWKKFEWNNKTIAFNILYVPYNNGKIRHVYKSKHNLKRKNQVIL